jgi:hypothetical protein
MEAVVSDDQISVGFEDRLGPKFDVRYLRELAGNGWRIVGMISEKSLSRSPNQTNSEVLLKYALARDQRGNIYYDCGEIDPILYETPGYNSVLFLKKEKELRPADFETIGESFLGEDQFKADYYDKCFSIVEAMASSYHDGGALFISVPPGQVELFVNKMEATSNKMGSSQVEVQKLGPKKKRR